MTMDSKLIFEVFRIICGDAVYPSASDLRWIKSAIKKPMYGWRMASRDLKVFDLTIEYPYYYNDRSLRYRVRVKADRDENILSIKGMKSGT